MADDLVHRGADALGKPAIVQGSGPRAQLEGVLVDEVVDVLGGDACLDHRADSTERVCGERTDLSHELNLTLRLDLDGTARETHGESRLGFYGDGGGEADKTCWMARCTAGMFGSARKCTRS